MSDRSPDVQATLDAWRQRGADGVDALRLQRITALAQRAKGEHGGVRRLLDERVAALMAAHAADLDRCPSKHARRDAAATAPRRPSAMAPLLEHIARQAVGHADSTGAAPTAPASATPGPLDDLRRLCTQARTESQLRQALEQPPEDAGPLNSASLVHRALTLMRDLSPDYLQPFMAYVDALAWLEGMDLPDRRASDNAAPTPGGAKRTRGKARSRRT